MGKIFDTLHNLQLTGKETRELFSSKTRDNENIKVWRDKLSGVIYIDEFYCGDSSYESGSYRQGKTKASFERSDDLDRRVTSNKAFIMNKNVCDIGCGNGDFLFKIKDLSSSVNGVELEKENIRNIRECGIKCENNILNFDCEFDSIFAFHSLEHFDDPLGMLKKTYSKLKIGGNIIIEVPHANDFLMKVLKLPEFIDFTLWSSHLILHTRESLRRFLESAGYREILIKGVQRYPLSNHLHWLKEKKPGGQKSVLSALDNELLNHAYEDSLNRIDANDTIVAFGVK